MFESDRYFIHDFMMFYRFIFKHMKYDLNKI